jgi:hypothetical protein
MQRSNLMTACCHRHQQQHVGVSAFRFGIQLRHYEVSKDSYSKGSQPLHLFGTPIIDIKVIVLPGLNP